MKWVVALGALPAPETPDFESQMIPRSRSTQPAATSGFNARMIEVA